MSEREKREKNVVFFCFCFFCLWNETEEKGCDVRRKRGMSERRLALPGVLAPWPFVLHLDTGGPCDTRSKTSSSKKEKHPRSLAFCFFLLECAATFKRRQILQRRLNQRSLTGICGLRNEISPSCAFVACATFHRVRNQSFVMSLELLTRFQSGLNHEFQSFPKQT